MNAPITLPPSEWLHWPQTRELTRAFEKAGKEMRFVGGCVRDTLLGRTVKDVDAATSATPEEVIELLEAANIKAIPTGIAHGTVTALIDQKPFEITTLRRDVETDGRRATVSFTDDWREDAKRRDFTLNALYCKPSGEVVDYFNGIADAKAGRIVFIGDARERITEDALRILRFFRFFAQFGNPSIDRDALSACAALAGMIDRLSGERIQAEMFKLLASPAPSAVVELMQQNQVLPQVIPEIKDVQILRMMEQAEKCAGFAVSVERRLAALLRGVKTNKSDQLAWVGERWKLSNSHRKQLQILVSPPVKVTASINEKEQKKIIRALGNETFQDLVLLAWAQDNLAHAELYRAMLKLAASWQPPEFPITGQDLLDAGIKPGKQMGELLKELEAHWEEQNYKPGKIELLKRVKK